MISGKRNTYCQGDVQGPSLLSATSTPSVASNNFSYGVINVSVAFVLLIKTTLIL